MTEDLSKGVEQLLEEERQAILSARFDLLGPIGRRKFDLLSRLDAGIGADGLRRIAARVARNQSLLSAALAGLRAATRRLAGIRTAAAGFDSYGADGQRAAVSHVQPPKFERKA